MTRRLLLLTLGTLFLLACTAPLQGPEADLHAIATPDPVPPAVVRAERPQQPVPQPAPGLTPEHGQFRAWIPKQVQPNGDEIQGHWLLISATPPPVEVLEPVTPMPRAPRTHFGTPGRPDRPQPSAPGLPSAGQPPLLQAPYPGSGAQPVPAGQPPRTLGGQRLPLAVPSLGGP